MDIPSRTLDDILSQAKESLPVGMETLTDSLSVGRTFEVWTLADLPIHGSDMRAAAIVEGSLHHELLANAKPIGFIRSELSEDGRSREVTQVFKAHLPMLIDEAFNRVDALVPGDHTARLFSSPEHQLLAFWFADPSVDKCYVITSPYTFRHLKPNDLVAGPDFLNGLRDETPIEGVLPPPPIDRQKRDDPRR